MRESLVASSEDNDDQDVVMEAAPSSAAVNPSCVPVNLHHSTQESVGESSHTEGPLKKKRRVNLISVEPATTVTLPEKEMTPISVGEVNVDREDVKVVEVMMKGDDGMIIIED
jgi:hypothetical protein